MIARLLRAPLSLFRGTLWGNPDFLLLWAGESISLVGTRVTLVALPSVAILVLGAGPLVVGPLIAVQWLPFLLLSPLAGVWADRRRRRPLLIATNLGRMVLLGAIPVAGALGMLSLPLLFAVALLNGVLSVLFQVAFRAYLRSIVNRDEYTEANARLQLSQSGAQLGGPPIAGVLIGLVGAAATIAADAFSYLVAAVTVVLIRRPEPAAAPTLRGGGVAGVLRDLGEGGRTVARSGILRNLMAMATFGNLALSTATAVLLLFLYRDLHLAPGVVGLALGAGGVGFLVGALLAQTIVERLGVGRALVLSAVLFGTGYLVLPLAAFGPAVPIVAVSQFLAGMQAGPGNVAGQGATLAVTPNALMGRVAGVGLTTVWGANAVGGLLGGWLGQVLGDGPTLALCGLLALSTAAFVIGPVMRFQFQPAGAS